MSVDVTSTASYLRSVSLVRSRATDPSVYPFNIPSIKAVRSMNFDRDVTFLIGENGCGKSTLLEAIAVAWGFNPEGGTVNFRFSTRSSHSSLSQHLQLVRSSKRPKDGFFLRAESFFNLATDIERMDEEPSTAPPVINSYGGRSLHEMSHGESFLTLMLHRFRGNGLYILDEPESALSPTRQLAMLRRMNELVSKNSQFIIATHSPILLAYPKARILEMTDKGLRRTNYSETEHYTITKDFITDPDRIINKLMMDD